MLLSLRALHRQCVRSKAFRSDHNEPNPSPLDQQQRTRMPQCGSSILGPVTPCRARGQQHADSKQASPSARMGFRALAGASEYLPRRVVQAAFRGRRSYTKFAVSGLRTQLVERHHVVGLIDQPNLQDCIRIAMQSSPEMRLFHPGACEPMSSPGPAARRQQLSQPCCSRGIVGCLRGRGSTRHGGARRVPPQPGGLTYAVTPMSFFGFVFSLLAMLSPLQQNPSRETGPIHMHMRSSIVLVMGM